MPHYFTSLEATEIPSADFVCVFSGILGSLERSAESTDRPCWPPTCLGLPRREMEVDKLAGPWLHGCREPRRMQASVAALAQVPGLLPRSP